jgi:hypothetical protein
MLLIEAYLTTIRGSNQQAILNSIRTGLLGWVKIGLNMENGIGFERLFLFSTID